MTRHSIEQTRAARPALQPTEDVVDLGTLFNTLWRGKWLIAALMLGLASLMAAYGLFVATPMFRSTAVVMLETRADEGIDITSVISDIGTDTASINTELQVLRSRRLLAQVVDRLDLTQDPEFNRRLVPDSALDPGAAARNLLRAVGVMAPAPQPTPEMIRESTVSTLLDAITVRNVSSSYVFEVVTMTTSARKSQMIANTIAEMYIENQVENKVAETEAAVALLTEAVAQKGAELEESEAELEAFSNSTQLISEEQLAALSAQAKDLRDRLAGAEADAAERRARQQVLAGAASDAAAFDAMADDARLAGLDPASPAAAARRAQILDRAEVEATRAETQAAALAGSLEDLEASIEAQTADLVQLRQLTRAVEANRNLYQTLLAGLGETSAQLSLAKPDSRLLSYAVQPIAPAAPSKTLLVAVGAMLGLMIGAAIVLVREAHASTFRSSEDLEAFTGLTVLGTVPLAPVRTRKKLLQYIATRTNSALAEAIRNLRTSVLLSNLDNPPQLIMITSSFPGEGKTTQSLLLAQNTAALDKRVLLIEGDIRRRVFGEYFGRDDAQKGLLAVISGEASLEETTFKPEGLDFDVLIGEKSKVNAADLYSSEAFKRFIAKAREAYDMIIIDTPPVLLVPDARVIGTAADAILYVVHWNKTAKRSVRDGIASFESIGLKVTGTVLGQMNLRQMQAYGYGEKYGYTSKGAKNYYHN